LYVRATADSPTGTIHARRRFCCCKHTTLAYQYWKSFFWSSAYIEVTVLYTVKDGKIRAKAIEYSVYYHCNLKCSACSHMSPYISKKFPTLDSFERDLEALNKVL